jgi:biopolymer transport protein ExbB
MTRILKIGFQTIQEGHASSTAVNEALEERASKVLAGPLVFVQYLQVVASVSPMMGLLGTVSGMVKAFRNIAAQGLGKPELLANNISEALITTATGLLIAIPALMAYFYFKNKYLAASSGIYEQIGSMTRLMAKNGMVNEGNKSA